MPDAALQQEIIDQLLEGIRRIERRFQGTNTSDELIADDAGLDRLDAIAMMLIAIGEGLKNFERIGGKSKMNQYQHIDWKGAKGLRDILSHHYFDLDAEIVFDVCKNRIPDLKQALIQIRKEL